MSSPEYSAATRRYLLSLARDSIEHGLAFGEPPGFEASPAHPEAGAPRASFVTLTRHGELRGCTGSLEASEALARSVVRNAYQTAFEDPRFRPVSQAELSSIRIEISVLSPLSPLAADTEAELLAGLRPHVDGLLMAAGPFRATFLPKVWEQLAEPRDFVAQLKAKAGLPFDYWSDAMQFWRYHTETFAEPEPVAGKVSVGD
jgi:AmmeMemoRadiSam system protein A